MDADLPVYLATAELYNIFGCLAAPEFKTDLCRKRATWHLRGLHSPNHQS